MTARRIRRLLLASLGGAMEWVYLYGAIWLIIFDRSNYTYALALGVVAIVTFVSLSLVWNGYLGRATSIRWPPKFWTVERVRGWLALGLVLSFLFLIFWLLPPIIVFLDPDYMGRFLPRFFLGGVGIPLGCVVIFLGGLLRSFHIGNFKNKQ